ncbi:hypothetical protein [Haloferax sulfurifontis]|uniref:Uncharacterized protein n=2 Tax=Haloferax sulfurifontis TaxID=255616 RepID=M0IL82_9EURY|nr:hypothetical protein [Haloferax sulfurifontis]ELZ96613.1 hypothetical protein C441_04574 [Haloferax sulfurifontis ATCC BAA-897]GGC72469.1 hypothetical protein GCM10007209_38000 [Haloferax sulfurifontis]
MQETNHDDDIEVEQPEFSELVKNSTMRDAHDSRDSALQYVGFDLADCDYSEKEQEQLLGEVLEKIESVADSAFYDGVNVAASRGCDAAAKYVINEITKELGDSAVEQRFEERLRQKEGVISMEFDSALSAARYKADQSLTAEVLNFTGVY